MEVKVSVGLLSEEQLIGMISLMLLYREGRISRQEYLKSCSATDEQLRRIEAHIECTQKRIMANIRSEGN